MLMCKNNSTTDRCDHWLDFLLFLDDVQTINWHYDSRHSMYMLNFFSITANFLGVWRHASTEFYGTAGDIVGMLESTIEPLKKIVRNQNGAHICGEWLARVKALLGHPVEEILQVFQYSLQNSDTGNKTKLYEKLGRYYESISDIRQAKENYQHAVVNKSENGGYYTPFISEKRLKELA